jgi:hypothetical protein
MAPPGECRPTWSQASAAYPKACAPGPVEPGGCQGPGTAWCGHQTITFSFGDSRGLMLCAYAPASGDLVGIVYSVRGTLTCRTYDPDFPPVDFYEDTCRPDGWGGGGGANTGGANTGGANTGGAATGGAATGGANTGGAATGGANTGGATGGAGGILEGGTESGVPDAHAGGSDAGQTDASSEGG